MSFDVFFWFSVSVSGLAAVWSLQPSSISDSAKAARVWFAASKTRDDTAGSFAEGRYFDASSWRSEGLGFRV